MQLKTSQVVWVLEPSASLSIALTTALFDFVYYRRGCALYEKQTPNSAFSKILLGTCHAPLLLAGN